jgi:hypothetical protein
MEPGTYDVAVQLEGGEVVVQSDAFSVVEPDALRVTYPIVPPGGTFEIQGDFFGAKKGKVLLRDGTGVERGCRIKKRAWNMSRIVAAVPKKILGLCDVIVVNGVGSDILRSAILVR